MTQIEILQKQIDELKKELNDMKRSSTLPDDISSAFIERLSDKEQVISRVSTATANVSMVINTSGSSASVFAFPDGFRVFRIGGRDYNIPYYNTN